MAVLAAPIPTTAFDLPAYRPIFSQLTAESLQNAGDTSDGFEAAFNSAVRALDGLASAHASLDPMILDAANGAAGIDMPDGAQFSSEVAQLVTDSNRAYNALASAITALVFQPSGITGLAPAPTPPLFTISGQGVPGSAAGGGTLADASEGAILGKLGVETARALSTLGLLPASVGLLAAGPVGVLIVAGIALAAVFAHFIGGGCGQPCIDASKAEQIYEAASDNLFAVGKAGMLARDTVVRGMQGMSVLGQRHLDQIGGPQATAGKGNMIRTISAEVAVASRLPVAASKPLTFAAARAVYVTGTNWYRDSLAAAAQLTDTYLGGLGAKG